MDNSPPKHSVIDFSSYLIQKRAEKIDATPRSAQSMNSFTECAKSANSFSESVQTKCSVSEVKQTNLVDSHHQINDFHHVTSCSHSVHSNINHMTCKSDHVMSGYNHSSSSSSFCHQEQVSNNMVLHGLHRDSDLHLRNIVDRKDPKPTVPYAKPKKGKSNLYFTTSIDLVNLPENTYFTSNLSDKLSDYEDIWKTNSSVYGVSSFKADLMNRLQPNLVQSINNNSLSNSPVKQLPYQEKDNIIPEKHKTEVLIDEKEVFKDSGNHVPEEHLVASPDINDNLPCKFCLCVDETATENNSLEAEETSSSQLLLHNNLNCEKCDREVLVKDDCQKAQNFEPIPEQESDIDSDSCAHDHHCCHDNQHGCHDNDYDHDADTEDCDYSGKNSVHTQTSPVVKNIPSPLSSCRKSASTSELTGLKSPVYAEPFDAINNELPSQNPPKVPKKMRRRSAPAFGAVKRKLGTSQVPSLTPIHAGLEVKVDFDELGQCDCVDEDCDSEQRNNDENHLTCQLSSSSSGIKKSKPTPSPRKSKLSKSNSQNSDTVVPNRKNINDVANRLEKLKLRHLQSDSPKRKNTLLKDPIRMMEDFENSQSMSSPTLQKFPVYTRQFFGESSNKTMYYESTTAEDIISSWNPELTLQPVKPFPIIVAGALSEYDNLHSTTGCNYLDPSSQSMASAGTIFCKPWENSTLGKLISSPSHMSPKPQSSAPKVAPPPLPPMDMHERIKAWQESSQIYQSVPTDMEEDSRKSNMSDIVSVEAKTFGGDGVSMSEMKVSTAHAGQSSQSNKTLVNEKTRNNTDEDKSDDNIPLFGADFREKILPVLGKF